MFMNDAIVVDYMVEKLGIDKSKILDLGNLLYKNYGTTMAGLRVWFWFTLSFFSWNLLWLFFFQLFWLVKLEHIDKLWDSLLQAIGYDFDYDEYHG